MLIDEVLAVGDKDFQIKCYQKIHEIRKRGTSIILVSHNEYSIREHTNRCVYLNNGKIRYLGPSEMGISRYIQEMLEHRSQNLKVGQYVNSGAREKAEIISLRFYNAKWKEITFLESGQELNIIFECLIKGNLTKPIFGVNFYDNSGFMYCANSDYENVTFDALPLQKVRVTINIPNFHLPMNNYICSATIAEEHVDNLIDWQNMAYRFVVGRARNARGSIKLPTKWDVETT
ncbi:MAG: Wzt carbohydrate-binding domain-containing protein [Methanotrichaceae archaeon]|nr:Wzt carbohydrate-binding domain-containing protein [Methanotrichaceae archaeon]